MAPTWTSENAYDEAVNAWIHAAAFLVSLPAAYGLYQLVASNRIELVWSCATYSLCLAGMYFFSTLSHSFRNPRLRARSRQWDQGVIYSLIAGTYTPFLYAYLDGWLRIGMLVAVWLAAALGFYSKVIAKHRIDNMESKSYVLLGWVPAAVLYVHVSTICFAAVLAGGMLYTIGTLFLMNDHRGRWFHATWHLMVVLASICHYTAIVCFVVLSWDKP